MRRLLMLSLAVPAVAGTLAGTVLDKAGKPVQDAVLVAFPVDGKLPPPRPSRDEIDQVNSEFVPYVKVVTAGADVTFPNKDNIRHQVYSFSPAKKFELPLYAGRAAAPVKFDKPGVVVLGCNIHDWMLAYVYVAESPWHALTGREGTAAIRDLPAGEYLVRVWQPRQKEKESETVKRVAVPAEGSAPVQWQITLKPDPRIRKHPTPGGGDY
jgi:hypothetical protein